MAQRLIEQIEVEKKTKLQKKINEREAAMKVIRENQEEKKKRLIDDEKRKEKENEDIEEMQRIADKK